MIPRECKRLAEVDFPIAVVSRHAAREKSIRHGHPSTLHLWWARRPLAACRAMLLGLLLPDPCDTHCPKEFKEKAREVLPRVQGPVGPKDEDLRRALLKFMGDFSNWDLSANPTYLEVSRGLAGAVHGDEPPDTIRHRDPVSGACRSDNRGRVPGGCLDRGDGHPLGGAGGRVTPAMVDGSWRQKRVAEDRRDCYWLYVVTHCDTEPRLQAIRDPAALPWHEVKKVDHYWLAVHATTNPPRVEEG